MMKTTTGLIVSTALGLLVTSAFAQDTPTPMQRMQKQQNSMTGMAGMEAMPSHMKGSHMMSVTVSSVDTNTGVVEGESAGIKLRLHFPPASLATVKAGDTINVHLAFTK